MNTTENNKLIAEFMGVIPTSTKAIKNWYNGQELSNAGLPFACGAMGNGTNELKFSTSWDWLMPCIAKIDNLDGGIFSTHVTKFHVYVNKAIKNGHDSERIIGCDCNGERLHATYQAVTGFILWYNEQKA